MSALRIITWLYPLFPEFPPQVAVLDVFLDGSLRMVIGLEVHTHLKTESKLFSPAPVQYGLPPNHSVSPVDLALPGVLPVLNERVVELAIRLGLAIHAT